MGTKPNYFKIGIFVIVAVILILAAVAIWGSGLFAEEKVYFETYFDESISGLSVGAPVEIRGVQIGRVERITFARNEYEMPAGEGTISKYEPYVMVVASAKAENFPALTPQERKARVKQLALRGLRLRLTSNLLTGLAYLEGDYLDPNRFPVLEVPWTPKHLYIPSAPGELTTIKQSVDKILHRLEKIDTEKIGLEIEQILVTLKEAIRDANVPQMTSQLTKTLQRIDELLATQRPEIEEAVKNLRGVLANLKDITESLKRHPSDLIFSQPPRKSKDLK